MADSTGEGRRRGGAAKTTWRCRACGFEVEVEGDELPADYVCPVCGLGREMFERVAG